MNIIYILVALPIWFSFFLSLSLSLSVKKKKKKVGMRLNLKKTNLSLSLSLSEEEEGGWHAIKSQKNKPIFPLSLSSLSLFPLSLSLSLWSICFNNVNIELTETGDSQFHAKVIILTWKNGLFIALTRNWQSPMLLIIRC